jgi:hypothetical protein
VKRSPLLSHLIAAVRIVALPLSQEVDFIK